MTDIVERIRKRLESPAILCDEAAQEIKTLRVRLEAFQERVRLLEQGIKAEKDLSRTLMIELRAGGK